MDADKFPALCGLFGAWVGCGCGFWDRTWKPDLDLNRRAGICTSAMY